MSYSILTMAQSFKSGTTVPATGSYWCTADNAHQHLEAGTIFPPCSNRDHHSYNYWTNHDPFPLPPPPIPDHKLESFFAEATIDGYKKKIKIRPFRRTTNQHLIPSQYTISVRNAYFDDLYLTSTGWQLKHRDRDKRLADEIGKAILTWFK